MTDGPQADTRFALPAVDDPASTEIGVILMGIEAVQLLAGLGLAALAEDPAGVTLLVDRARHGGAACLTLGQLAAVGVARWRAERDAHQLAWTGSTALRQAWAQVYRAVTDQQAGAPATVAYLTACWLRSAEIDRYASQYPSGDGL